MHDPNLTGNPRRTGARIPRRRVLRGMAGAALGLALPGGAVIAAGAAAAAPITAGILYPGSAADFGVGQSHADAMRTLTALPGVRVEQAEDTAADLPARVEEMLVKRGCRVLFVTDPGAWTPALLAQADAHRDAVLLLRGADPDLDRLPANVGTYGAYLEEGQHVAGIVAGYASRGHRIGFVAAADDPRALRCVNAFALGARRADTDVVVRLVRLDAAADAAAAARAARALIAGGVDVLAGHLDSVRPLCEAAEAAGIACCGLHTDLSAIAPQGFLTGAETRWDRLYADVVTAVQAGRPWSRLTRGGFGGGLVRSTPYGAGVGVEARAHADAARMQLANGSASVFRGPILDNTGRTVLPKGKSLRSDDPALDRAVWLVDGVVEVDA